MHSWNKSLTTKARFRLHKAAEKVGDLQSFVDSLRSPSLLSTSQVLLLLECLHLAPGDRIKFFIHPDGDVVILPKVRTTALRGIVRMPKRRVSLDDMDTAIAEVAIASRQRLSKG